MPQLQQYRLRRSRSCSAGTSHKPGAEHKLLPRGVLPGAPHRSRFRALFVGFRVKQTYCRRLNKYQYDFEVHLRYRRLLGMWGHIFLHIEAPTVPYTLPCECPARPQTGRPSALHLPQATRSKLNCHGSPRTIITGFSGGIVVQSKVARPPVLMEHGSTLFSDTPELRTRRKLRRGFWSLSRCKIQLPNKTNPSFARSFLATAHLGQACRSSKPWGSKSWTRSKAEQASSRRISVVGRLQLRSDSVWFYSQACSYLQV